LDLGNGPYRTNEYFEADFGYPVDSFDPEVFEDREVVLDQPVLPFEEHKVEFVDCGDFVHPLKLPFKPHNLGDDSEYTRYRSKLLDKHDNRDELEGLR
jgi:hypothetical protein